MSTDNLSNEQHKRASRLASYQSIIVLPVIFLVLIGGLMFVLNLYENQNDTPDSVASPTPTRDVAPTLSVSPAVVADEETLLRFHRISLLLEIAQAERAIDHANDADRDWHRVQAEVRTNEAGRQLASDSDLLIQFIALENLAQSDDSVSNLQSSLNELAEEAETIAEQWSIESVKTRVVAIEEQAKQLNANYQGYRQALNRLLIQAAALPASSITLAETIETREQTRLDGHRTRIAQLVTKSKADIDAEYQRLVTTYYEDSQRVDKLKGQLDLAQKTPMPQMPQLVEDKPDPALVKSYQSQKTVIATYLAPFITPGYKQPDNLYSLKTTVDKLPMSYTGLLGVGALHDSEDGIKTLQYMMRGNDRPDGGYSLIELRLLKPDQIEQLKTAQKLLRSYGKLMVDDGLLSP